MRYKDKSTSILEYFFCYITAVKAYFSEHCDIE